MFTRLSPYLAMTLLSAGTLSAADTPTLSTSLSTDKEHKLNFAFDGDRTTYFSTSEKPREGATLQFDYTDSLKGKNVTIHTGLPDRKNRIYYASLQVSENNKDWVTIGKFSEGKAEGKITADAKHMRIQYDSDAWTPSSISEIQIGDQKLTRKSITRKVKAAEQEIDLTIVVDTEHMEDSTEFMNQFVERYFIEWPITREWIDAPIETTPRELHLHFDPTIKHPAHVMGSTMVLSLNHIKKHPEDAPGVFSHELTHVVQNYGGKAPGWFTEGLADYVRYQHNKDSRWAIGNKTRNNKRINPLGSYWWSTAFLMWLEETHEQPIIAPVSRACSLGEYSEDIWKTLTGKTLEQLTKEYESSK